MDRPGDCQPRRRDPSGANAAEPAPPLPPSHAAPGRIGPDDPRYAVLLRRGLNKRFAGKPDYVRLVTSTAEVVAAVQEAVGEGLRLAVRGGGHCLEGFVANPDVRVLIDTSLMTGVWFDPQMGAFAVEAVTTLAELYRRLYLGWGVTLPAGESPDIGVGGHVTGGAFGFLCRQHGLAADHLHAVEVVVVDATGTARSVVASREPSDPNHDRWWAHRRRRRQLRRGDPLLVPLARRRRHRSRLAAPEGAAVGDRVSRPLELGRHRPGGVREADPQLRRLVRAPRRCDLALQRALQPARPCDAASTASSR